MGEAARQRVVVLGAGRVATHLVPALIGAGYRVEQVWSRTATSAHALAQPLGVPYTDDLDAIAPDADIYIACVADGALPEVARRLCQRLKAHSQQPIANPPLLLHTAGSVPMDVWREAGAQRYGILYPLQTFSKERQVDMREVSLFVEASDADTLSAVESLAQRLSGKVFRADSRRRALLHVAAVFACNFTNAMYAVAHQLLATDDIPFEVLLPLIDETAAKVHALAPREAQTGPAVRGDEAVMQAHLDRLASTPDLQAIYAQISRMIAEARPL